jgi:hypothetical protein
MTTVQDHPGTSAPTARAFPGDGGENTLAACPWHPLPEEAIVQLVAIERRAIHTHRAGSPTQPARVVWSVLIPRGATTHERHDLPPAVYRALARDGGERVRPMSEISGRRLNAAVETATDPSVAPRDPVDGDVPPDGLVGLRVEHRPGARRDAAPA